MTFTSADLMEINQSESGVLLLMGSSGYAELKLPLEVREKIDIAIESNMRILVGEAKGASRLYQDYLISKCYENVVVGHAKSIRYNAGNWRTVQFGQNLKDRERSMIENCDSAIIIWNDHSSVIANNLELLKNLGKLTFVYEYDSKNKKGKFSLLDPTRVYRPNYRYRRII